MDDINYFTQQSIELANQRNYLDLLFNVYPLSPDIIRVIDDQLWDSIKSSYNGGNNVELFKSLLKLNLFPIKDGYVPFFRRDPSAIIRNPQTVNRICGRVRELSLDELYQKCTEPKETNRQMGALFRRWLNSGVLGMNPVSEDIFMSDSQNAILDGSDAKLLAFAFKHLGYKREKGVDFIARFNNKYIIGEAKFISDEGGHQNAQFNDAIATIKTQSNPNVINIAIMDGVLYIKSNTAKHRTITENNIPVMSALLLRDYLYSL